MTAFRPTSSWRTSASPETIDVKSCLPTRAITRWRASKRPSASAFMTFMIVSVVQVTESKLEASAAAQGESDDSGRKDEDDAAEDDGAIEEPICDGRRRGRDA